MEYYVTAPAGGIGCFIGQRTGFDPDRIPHFGTGAFLIAADFAGLGLNLRCKHAGTLVDTVHRLTSTESQASIQMHCTLCQFDAAVFALGDRRFILRTSLRMTICLFTLSASVGIYILGAGSFMTINLFALRAGIGVCILGAGIQMPLSLGAFGASDRDIGIQKIDQIQGAGFCMCVRSAAFRTYVFCFRCSGSFRDNIITADTLSCQGTDGTVCQHKEAEEQG
jgi:hypothetical protein